MVIKFNKAHTLAAWLVVLVLSACATPKRMATSSDIPAAEATVKTERTDNGNTSVVVSVKHLAPIDRVDSNASAYVLWAQPADGGKAQNLGAFKVDRNLEGKIQALTPLHDFKLFITAESSGLVSQPKNIQLLWTNIASS